MKKFISLFIFLACILSVFTLNKNFVYAKESETNVKSSYLVDFNSGTVISSSNENNRYPIASMTKIMLLYLIYKNESENLLDFNETITISENASKMGGSQVFLEANGNYYVKDLVKSIVVASANDASVAMAERLYGSEENCVSEMNNQAKKLGCSNTLFSNCTGLPKPMQYSCAKDIAKIFCELIKYNKYFEFSNVWLDKINHKDNYTEITNTNKLIKFYNGCDGGKTGFTNEAGFCLTATAKRGNMRLVSVVIGADSSKTRFKMISDMFNYGFNNYTNKCIIDSKIPLDSKIEVQNGKKSSLECVYQNNYYLFAKKNEKIDVDFVYNISSIKAPIKKGDVVGECIIYKDGVEINKVKILSNENINKKSYLDYLTDIIKDIA